MTRRGALAEHPSHSPKENVFPRQDTRLILEMVIVRTGESVCLVAR